VLYCPVVPNLIILPELRQALAKNFCLPRLVRAYKGGVFIVSSFENRRTVESFNVAWYEMVEPFEGTVYMMLGPCVHDVEAATVACRVFCVCVPDEGLGAPEDVVNISEDSNVKIDVCTSRSNKIAHLTSIQTETNKAPTQIAKLIPEGENANRRNVNVSRIVSDTNNLVRDCEILMQSSRESVNMLRRKFVSSEMLCIGVLPIKCADTNHC